MDSIFNHDDILYEILKNSDYNVTHKLYILLRPRKLIYKSLSEIEKNYYDKNDRKYKNEFIKELVKQKELIFGIKISHCILDTLNNTYYSYIDNRWMTTTRSKMTAVPIDNFEKDPKHLICFNNGVYDLKQATFRKSNLYDYCTLTTGDDFPDNLNNESRSYKLKLFPVKEDYIHFMKILYLIFLGKKFYINTIGTKCNGFTTLLNILNYMFLDYAKRIQARFLKSRVMYKFHSFLEDYKRDNYKLLILNDDTTIENIKDLTTHCSIIQENYSNLYLYDIPQTKPLHFRSTFDSHENPEQYIYLKDNIPIDAYSKKLMSQLIYIHESVEPMMIFKYSDLNNDIKNLIIDQYMILIFDV